jgi:hypothetical protein
MTIAHELPEGVELSPHLRERASFYIEVMLDGITYYIAATPHVRRLFELDERGRPGRPDRRRKFDSFEKEKALRDITSSIHLQLRDVVLAGIEADVSRVLLGKMRRAMAPTIRAHVFARTPRALLTTGGETGEDGT